MQPRTLSEQIADSFARLRALNSKRPTGTKQRRFPGRLDSDGKSRGQRKHEARVRADARVAEDGHRPAAAFSPALTNYGGGISAGKVAAIEAGTAAHELAERVLTQSTVSDTENFDRIMTGLAEIAEDKREIYVDEVTRVVHEFDGKFWVALRVHDEFTLEYGPYKDRKTANRRLRQLGG